MTTLAKVATIGTVGVGGITGSYFVVKNSMNSSHFRDPNAGMSDWRHLYDDENFSSTYTSDTYAYKYQKFLVGVGTAAQYASPSVNTWWDWPYTKRYLKDNVTSGGFANKKSKEELMQACELAYKGTLDSSTGEVTNGDNKYKEVEIWKYCSAGGTKIKTLSETANENYGTETYGGDTNNRLYLVSIEDPDSDWFWKYQEKNFFSYLTDNLDDSTAFKKLLKENSSKIDYSSSRLIRDKCKEAYGKSKSADATTYPENEVNKYCSIKKS